MCGENGDTHRGSRPSTGLFSLPGPVVLYPTTFVVRFPGPCDERTVNPLTLHSA